MVCEGIVGEILRLWQDRPVGKLVEVGACDGVSYDSCIGMLKSGWKGLLIEPSPLAYPLLVQNCSAYDAVLVNVACGPPTEFGVTFHYLPGKIGMGTIFADARRWWEEHDTPGWKSEEVSCVPLSYLMDSFGFGDADIVKIDVESAEGIVLEGLDLTRHRPYIITLEVSPRSIGRGFTYMKRLNEFGYYLTAATDTDDIYTRS